MKTSLRIETDEINCKAVSAGHQSDPTLYQVTAQLQDESGCVIDDLIDRVGFREVKTLGKGHPFKWKETSN